jgi:hypothetical protein
MTKKATKPTEPLQPVGPLHYVPGGQMREFSDGWHCTCGGKPGAECDHIKEIWRILKERQGISSDDAGD